MPVGLVRRRNGGMRGPSLARPQELAEATR